MVGSVPAVGNPKAPLRRGWHNVIHSKEHTIPHMTCHEWQDNLKLSACPHMALGGYRALFCIQRFVTLCLHSSWEMRHCMTQRPCGYAAPEESWKKLRELKTKLADVSPPTTLPSLCLHVPADQLL